MRKRFLFWAVIAIISIAGCGKPIKVTENSNQIEDSNVNMMNGDFKKHFNELSIEGQKIKVPFDYDKFMQLGFQDSSENNIEVKKGQPLLDTLTDDEGDKIKTYVGYKGSSSSKFKHECEIVSVYASRDSVGDMNIAFYGNITFNSTEDQVSKVLDLVQSENGSSLYALKINQYIYFSVSFKEGKVNDIMIINGKGYFN